jgi:hypothetical protein
VLSVSKSGDRWCNAFTSPSGTSRRAMNTPRVLPTKKHFG